MEVGRQKNKFSLQRIFKKPASIICAPAYPSLKTPPFFSVRLRPNAGHGLLILEVHRSHTATHHSRYDSSGRVISLSQRPLPDNTQHSQQTNIHAPCGIRTHDISKRAAADLRLRPRGHWDRLPSTHYSIKLGLELYHHFPIIINVLMHKSQFRLYKAVNL